MKQSLSEYASSLANSDIDVLEDLISKKYRKFIKFFALIRDFSEYIQKLDYEFDADDVLSVKITFSKQVDLDDKKELISDMKKSGYKVDSDISGKKMKLTIKYAE